MTRRILLFVACAAAASCAHPQAKVAVELPPLDVPAPPPRAVEPTGSGSQPPVGLITEPARNEVPRSPATPAQPPPRTDQPRADAPPRSEPTATPDAPRPPDDAARSGPSPTLQTTPAPQEAEREARIRAAMNRAMSDLNRIDYTKLSANARSQYDSAKRFVSLAEDAMHQRNLVYASTLADKAAELAAQLAGR